jgi:hypothetical protein
MQSIPVVSIQLPQLPLCIPQPAATSEHGLTGRVGFPIRTNALRAFPANLNVAKQPDKSRAEPQPLPQLYRPPTIREKGTTAASSKA